MGVLVWSSVGCRDIGRGTGNQTVGILGIVGECGLDGMVLMGVGVGR